MKNDANPAALMALSPLDGRYQQQMTPLQAYFSEQALMRYRLVVEVRWLQALAAEDAIVEVEPFQADDQALLQQIMDHFGTDDAERIKQLERVTNHDVKAVEYFLRERLADTRLERCSRMIHFACTSEDVTNLAYAMIIHAARDEVLLPWLDRVIQSMVRLAQDHRAVAMLSRTHGQPASPTTLGKEMAIFADRLRRQRDQMAAVRLPGKINGAVGNFNAHQVAYPEVDWLGLTSKLLTGMGLEPRLLTTQIEPHDELAALCHAMMRCNTVLLDFDRDVWGYIAMGYFRQKLKAHEVGSSTMPHKVNPIDFENSEGNIGLANALLGHLADKLPVSRWQRDLSDSTVLRNVGVAFGHTLLALQATDRGIGKLEVNHAVIAADLNQNWEVLAEAIQTVMRRHGMDQAYEQLKELTRGRRIGPDELHAFVATLPLPQPVQQRLLALTPEGYTGLAELLVAKMPVNIVTR
ncbi:MAG: adenylosuccinate lyase [Magnetococcales bacterium]|nr:adenylosuccinate lyase [Magnetococcales bacterium]